MKKIVLAIMLIVGLMIFANAQEASATIIDFGRVYVTTPGTISYAGGSNPLVGNNIQLDIVSNGSPSLVYNLLNCRLNFTTGVFTGSDTTQWYFAPGGSLVVTGTVDVDGSGTTTTGDVSGTLMSGTFIGSQTVMGGTQAKVAFTTFADLKEQELAQLFGISPEDNANGWSGYFNLGFIATGTPPSSFTSNVVSSGDIVNVPNMPEPTSMVLLGMGLVGLVGRKLRKKFMA